MTTDGPLVFSRLVQREVRAGSLEEQCRATWDEIADAVRRQDAGAALALADFAVGQECRPVSDILTGWAEAIRALLARRGVEESELADVDDRLRALLAYPDGEPYSPELGWERLEAAMHRLRVEIEGEEWEQALTTVSDAREAWRVVHDRIVDASYGWMSAFVGHFGEASVPDMYREIAGHHFEEFFELGDPAKRSWTDEGSRAVLWDTIEAMRIHLSTLRRDGAPFELVEYADRWEMSFDPCGSGGRALRGDIVEGTPSRLDPPYEFAHIQGAYDWTDGTAGMCVYCNHCQLLYEQWPMERAGFPFLVVDPPTYPDGVGHENPPACRYTIYKRPEAVPDEVFRRCGRERPEPSEANDGPHND